MLDEMEFPRRSHVRFVKRSEKIPPKYILVSDDPIIFETMMNGVILMRRMQRARCTLYIESVK